MLIGLRPASVCLANSSSLNHTKVSPVHTYTSYTIITVASTTSKKRRTIINLIKLNKQISQIDISYINILSSNSGSSNCKMLSFPSAKALNSLGRVSL